MANSNNIKNQTGYNSAKIGSVRIFYFQRDPTPTDFRNPFGNAPYNVGDEWQNKTSGDIWKLFGIAANLADWVLIGSGGGLGPVLGLRDNAGTDVLPDITGFINVVGNNVADNGFAALTLSQPGTNTLKVHSYGGAKWVVNPIAGVGTHTTITAAIATAVSGDTIFITPGTYIENPTMKAGVDLTAFGCDGLVNEGNEPGNVTIQGKVTFGYSGNCTVSGIKFKTNGDYCIYGTSSNATTATFVNCYVYAFDFNAIKNDNSSAQSRFYFMYCMGDIGNTGIAYYDNTGAGVIRIIFCHFQNNPVSLTASTGKIDLQYSFFPNSITSTAGVTAIFSRINATLTISSTSVSSITNSLISAINASGSSRISISNSNSGAIDVSNSAVLDADFSEMTTVTLSDTATAGIRVSTLIAGSASAITANAGTSAVVTTSTISSSNTNALTGAGAISYGGLTFTSSSGINVTSPTVLFEGQSRLIGGSKSGGTVSHIVQNTSNTAASSAAQIITVAGTSAGDPYTRYEVTGQTSWVTGTDTDDSQAFKINRGSTPSAGTNYFDIQTTGEITMPLQPAFSAYQAANVTNATGNGTAYQLQNLTEIFDRNADFNPTTGVFTAPKTGIYSFNAIALLTNATILAATIIQIVTTARTYQWTSGQGASSLNQSSTLSVLADMTAGDTAHVIIAGFGEAADTDTVAGGADFVTGFSGKLEC